MASFTSISSVSRSRLNGPRDPPQITSSSAFTTFSDQDVHMDEIVSDETEEDEDEEVDQLDSTEDELDAQAAPNGVPASSASASTSKQRVRAPRKKPATDGPVPGQPPIPMSRLVNIIESEGISTSEMSKEAIFLISAATEGFIKRLTETSYRHASVTRRATITYHDIASSAQQSPEFMFLDDTIPQPITLTEALKRRSDKEKELFDTLPSISAPPMLSENSAPPTAPPSSLIFESSSTAPSPMPSIDAQSISEASVSHARNGRATRGKGKARQVNGTASVQANGSSASANVNATSKATASTKGSVAAPPAESPATNPMPRRQSMREPKPRRRPDGQDEPRHTASATKEVSPKVSSAKSAATLAVAVPTTKTRPSRARRAAKTDTTSNSTSVSAPARNGHHLAPPHLNGAMTRSRRNSAAVPLPDTRQTGLNAASLNVLDGPGIGASVFGAPKSDLTENPGRTIYSQHRAPATSR